jgi:hypothetical protein
MSSRPVTPASGAYGSLHDSSMPGVSEAATNPQRPTSLSRNASHASRRSQVGSIAPEPEDGDLGSGPPRTSSALSQHDQISNQNDEAFERSSILRRSTSQLSQSQGQTPSRGGTLKKKSSMRRSLSKRSSYAGSVKSLRLGEKEKYAETDENMSVFYSPVPTNSQPTQLLADRFQGMLFFRKHFSPF